MGGGIDNFLNTRRISILRPDLDSIWNFEFIEKKFAPPPPHGIFVKKKNKFKKNFLRFFGFSRGHHGRASGSKNL